MSADPSDTLKALRDATVGAGEISQQDWAEAVRVLTVLSEPVTPSSVLEQLNLLGKLSSGKKLRIASRLENLDAGQVQRLGRFRMLSILGQGEMGVVYDAEDTMSGKHFALKVLPRQFRNNAHYVERFKREGKIALELNHPNIVRCDEYGELDGFLYYAMEKLTGKTLQASIAEGPIKPVTALRYMIDITDALVHAHKAGIIHRDLKPENLFLLGDGTVKILDMGLSKDVRTEETGALKLVNAAIGTPDYMSPEQTKAVENIDGRADIYSLGATFFHLLTGRVPFPGTTAREVMIKQNNEAVPDPRTLVAALPEDLCKVIQKMMEKEPKKRYKDCEELLDALIACENARRAIKRMNKTKRHAPTASGKNPAPPKPSHLRAILLFLLVLAVAGFAILYLMDFMPWLDPWIEQTIDRMKK